MDSSLNSWVREAADVLVAFCNPERIILYGSYAKGTAGPASDIDLIIVHEAQGSQLERRVELRQLFASWSVHVDASVYTREELEYFAKEDYSFLRAALLSGIEVFRRA